MRRKIFWLSLFCSALALGSARPAVAQAPPTAKPHLILVTGAAGTAEYGQQFSAAAHQWQELAKTRHWQLTDLRVDEDKPNPQVAA